MKSRFERGRREFYLIERGWKGFVGEGKEDENNRWEL